MIPLRTQQHTEKSHIMKPFIKPFKMPLLILIHSMTVFTVHASDINETFKKNTIEISAQYLNDYYVFQKSGNKAAMHLNELYKTGHFDSAKDLQAFISQINKAIYSVTYDKHIAVSIKPESQTNHNELDSWVESRMEERGYFRLNNANFKTIKKLHGNIGYLELRGFYGLSWGKNFADYAMDMLSTSDAIIIDLRNNHGGRGDMVEYLLSHFFGKTVPTTKTTKRHGDDFSETINYTKEYLGMKKMPDIPLFILISNNTFSAAEGFSYPIKVHKRGLFIGETTKGGANAGDLIPLNNRLNIFTIKQVCIIYSGSDLKQPPSTHLFLV